MNLVAYCLTVAVAGGLVVAAGWFATAGLLTCYFWSLVAIPPFPFSVFGGQLQLADFLGAALLLRIFTRRVGEVSDRRLRCIAWFKIYLLAGLCSVMLAALATSDASVIIAGSLRILRLAFGLFAVGVAARERPPELLRRLYYAMLLCLAFGLLFFMTQRPYPWSNSGQAFYFGSRIVIRAQGAMADPSAFGFLAVIVIALTLFVPSARLLSKQGHRLGVVVLGCLCIIASGSRAAIVAAAVILGISYFRRSGGSRLALGRSLAVGVVGTMAVVLAGRQLMSILSTRIDGVHASSADSLLSGRLSLWDEVLATRQNGIREFLFGSGFRSFRVLETGSRSDNAFVSSLVETGVAGLVAYTGFCLSLLRAGRRETWPKLAFVVVLCGSLTNDFQTFWRLIPLLLLPLALLVPEPHGSPPPHRSRASASHTPAR